MSASHQINAPGRGSSVVKASWLTHFHPIKAGIKLSAFAHRLTNLYLIGCPRHSTRRTSLFKIKKRQTSIFNRTAMATILRVLLAFTIMGACTCMAFKTMPIPSEGGRSRRSPEDNWPGVYPESIVTIGGVYASRANGVYTADGTYNDRPVYKNGGWSIYYRTSGYATNDWVLDFNDVSEDWDGTVAIQSTLFASNV